MIPVKKLLVTEDDYMMRKAITKTLSRLNNVEISEAADGLECLLKIDEDDPDIVLLDLLMPKMGGLDVLRTLQARGDRLTRKLIVLSSMVEPGMVEQLEHLGVSLALSKPFHLHELLDTLRDIVDDSGSG